MRSFFVLLFLGVVLVSIALVVRSGIFSRDNPGVPINAAMRVALGENARPWADRDLQIMSQRYKGAIELPSGLRYLVRKAGSGETPKRGQVVTVNYEGRFLADERVFDSSANHGAPFNFRIGEGVVISGWDEGVIGMRPGEKRTLIVPYWLGYGEKGIRGKIAPHAALVFDIELLKVE